MCPGAGDLIQLSSVNQRKTSLAWHKSAFSTPESVVTLTKKKKKKKSRSDLRNNLPSQPSGDDVSFLITNCLFMLQQLPRAANKWLKECLDQAFRPLLSGGCYLVDSHGSSCLVWKGAEMGRLWLTAGPWGSARMAPRLYPPGSKVKARALPWGSRWKEMLEGNEKNLLAKFAIMNTSPRGESSASGHRVARSGPPEPRGARISDKRRRPLEEPSVSTHTFTVFFSFFFFFILFSDMG